MNTKNKTTTETNAGAYNDTPHSVRAIHELPLQTKQSQTKKSKIMKTMKKLAAMCLIAAGTITMNAQNVGISAVGVPPSGDAGLDINFTDKGVLIPRVSLSSLTTYNPPITGGGPTTSMLIYNTNTTIGTGYYYWDGSKWVKLITNGGTPSDAWLTLGNAGTTPGTHFLGTTDNVDLVFKTNNTEQMRITSGGNVGIGTTAPVDKLHVSGGNIIIEGTGSSTNPRSMKARYTTSDANSGSFGWNGLQLGNNGSNYIVAGNTAAGGSLNFIVNNTNSLGAGTDYATANGINAMMISNTGNVGIGTTAPNNSALLELNSTTRGFLIPRMTTAQRGAIAGPANSLLIFNTTVGCIQIYNAASSAWENIYCFTGCTGSPSAPTANAATGISTTSFVANWNSVAGATGYYLDVATDVGFTSFVTGYNNQNVGSVTTYNVTGLTCGTTYYYRVRAYNSCGTSANSNIITVTTYACPKIYVIGGWNGTRLTTNEAYDPAANTWVTKASMPTARSEAACSAVNNVIYVIAGTNGSALTTNEAYDSSTNTWTSKASKPTACDGPAYSAVNNVIYVIGGMTGAAYTGVNEAYDPATNTWTTKASMPTARRYPTASPVNNIIYVIGGTNGPVLSTNEAYDPATNSWTTKASMPTARSLSASSAVNNVIYVIGGFNGPSLNTNEAYDPATNTWTTKASMPTARYDLTSSAVNNVIYAIGGNNGSYLSTNEAYDPATNTWTTRASMPTIRQGAVSAVAP